MRKELLVNAAPPETRVALTEDGRVVEVLHERRGRQGLVGNVYLGRVHRVLPGMQAAFVSIGLERDAFLYVEDAAASPEFDFGEDEGETGARRRALAGEPGAHRRPGQGGAGDRRAGPQGPARREGPSRDLGDLSARAAISSSCRARARSASRGASPTTPSASGCARSCRDCRRTADSSPAPPRPERPPPSSNRTGSYLTDLAARIARRRESAAPPALLHRELDLPLRALRDLVGDDVDAIRVDDPATRDRIVEFLDSVASPLARRVELYEDGRRRSSSASASRRRSRTRCAAGSRSRPAARS